MDDDLELRVGERLTTQVLKDLCVENIKYYRSVGDVEGYLMYCLKYELIERYGKDE